MCQPQSTNNPLLAHPDSLLRLDVVWATLTGDDEDSITRQDVQWAMINALKLGRMQIQCAWK